MARLFITPREVALISDLTKEIIKDVIGQKIYYYRVREEYTQVHDIYEEALNKVFDPPVEIGARVEWNSPVVSTNNFGTERYQKVNVFIQYQDMMDRGIEIREGDYLSYGTAFFEIATIEYTSLVFGEVEYTTGYNLACTQARIGQIDKIPHGPTDIVYSDAGAIQEVFVQQRGFAENRLGPTGDKRTLIEQGKLDLPPQPAPAEVSPEGSPGQISSAFYDES